MDVIYTPKGKAREYAPLALNHYKTCEHACKFCYCPQTLHVSPDDFFQKGVPKENIIGRVAKDCKKLHGNDSEILLSFIGDPYQPIEIELQITRQIIQILIENDLRFTILTKGGTRAIRDFDLLEKYSKCSFGTSLSFIHQKFANEWELNAPIIEDRIEAIRIAHGKKIKTWVSLEPVINPDEAFQTLAFLHRWVRHWKIGKINHWPELEAKVDWIDFREKVKEFMEAVGGDYYLKKSLTEL